MAGSANDNPDETISGINVTPLVDIVLVLLIIFMVTANFIVNDQHDVDLPRAAHATEAVQGLINVVIDKSDQVFFDGAQVNEDVLKTKVREALQKDPETRAAVSADASLPYGRVMHFIDLVKGEGIAKFSLVVQEDVAPQKAP